MGYEQGVHMRTHGNRQPASSGGTAPLALPVIGAAVESGAPDLIDAEALADMQAFNDLKAKRKRQRKKKIIVAAVSVVVVAVIGVGAFMWYSADQAARALEESGLQTGMVERGTFEETVSASGNLQPVASVTATPEVDGIVGEVLVAVGDRVEAGQTLFTVVNADLDKAVAQAAQGIEQARNGVAQAQASLDDAYHAKESGRLAAAQAQAQAQAQAAAAAAAAADPNLASSPDPQPASFEAAPFDEGSYDSAIRQAELGVSNANLALQSAQEAHAEAVARADKRIVKAAIAGSVVAVNIEPGKALGGAQGSPVTAPVQIADLSQMTVSIGVNEIDILKITADQEASVTFTAAPDLTLPAKVVNIATTSTGFTDGSAGMYGGPGGPVTYTVKLLIAQPDPRLKPGMTAKATIVTKKVEDTLLVPISAVQSDGSDKGFVLVLTDPETQQVEQRSIEVVASDGLTSAVKGMLKEGEQVVVSGMPADFAPGGSTPAGAVADVAAGGGAVVVG